MKKNYLLKLCLITGLLTVSFGSWASKIAVTTFTPGSLQATVEAAQGGAFASDTLEVTGNIQFAADDYTYLKSLACVMNLSGYEFTDATMPILAFENAKLTGFVLPENLKVVSRQVFKGCSGLQSIVIPATVDTVGNNCFDSCSELLNVAFLSDNAILGTQVFRNCYKLVSVNVPSKNKQLNGVFYSCRALTSAYIPATVDSIGASTFFGCENLASLYMARTTPPKIANTGVFRFSTPQIIVPKGSLAAYKAADIWKDLTLEIREADVVYVSNFESGKLQEAVETKAGGEFKKDALVIGGNLPFATEDYTYLKSLTAALDLSSYLYVNNNLPENAFTGALFNAISLPSTLKSIGRYALDTCNAITSIIMPASVDSISLYALRRCSNLKRVEFAPGSSIRAIMNAAFEKCTSLDSITLPNSIENLGGNVFLGCTKLVYATIPTGISILNGTFQGCTALPSVVIPENIKTISFQTFWNCTSLQTIYAESPTPPTLPSVAVFGGVPRTAIVYVNDETAKAAYEAAPKWSDLVNSGIRILVKGSTDIKNIKAAQVVVNTYPNPVVDQLNIESSDNAVIYEVVVSGLNGQIIGRYNPEATRFSLPASDWSGGVYMIKVVTGNGASVCKIVKK